MKTYTLILSTMSGLLLAMLGISGIFLSEGGTVFYLPVIVIGALVIYGNGKELLARAKKEKPKKK